MNKLLTNLSGTCLAALLAAACLPAQAAPFAQFGDPEPAHAVFPAPLVALANMDLYAVASGGIGDEERAALEAQARDFSMRLVFSEQNGQYVVADTVSLRRAGNEVLHLDQVGPLVYAKVPAGQYALTVSYKGVTQTRTVNIGARNAELHLTWPTVLD
jgi:hypothetical protein